MPNGNICLMFRNFGLHQKFIKLCCNLKERCSGIKWHYFQSVSRPRSYLKKDIWCWNILVTSFGKTFISGCLLSILWISFYSFQSFWVFFFFMDKITDLHDLYISWFVENECFISCVCSHNWMLWTRWSGDGNGYRERCVPIRANSYPKQRSFSQGGEYIAMVRLTWFSYLQTEDISSILFMHLAEWLRCLALGQWVRGSILKMLLMCKNLWQSEFTLSLASQQY